MIPFAVAFKSLLAEEKISGIAFGTIALLEILVFITTFIVAYIYVWKKGTFDWGIQARAVARAEAHELVTKKQERIQELKRAA
jgi:uncharacterized membrane protein (DUF485 family)